MGLLPKLSVISILLILSSSFAKHSLAATKAGINIATQYGYLETALDGLTNGGTQAGGWLYLMASPADEDFLNLAAARAEEAGVHLVIRGQCGGDPATSDYAAAWAEVLAGLPTANKIYFMPWNEPNGPAAGDIIDPTRLNNYISALIDAFDRYGIRDKDPKLPRKVVLLSPMINQYGNIEEYASQLRDQNANFFAQFDGISLNLYALYKNQPTAELIDTNDFFRNSIGYPKVLEVLGASADTPVYAVESGVAIWKGAGLPLVRYSDAIPQLVHLYGDWVKNGESSQPYRHWDKDANFKMFTIFSYSPDSGSPDYNHHWLFEEESKGVLEAMRLVGGGELPIAAQSMAEPAKLAERVSQALRELKPIDGGEFASCGGAGGQALIDTSMVEKTNSDPIILKYQKGFWEGGAINLGTILLKNKGSAEEKYRFESYQTIANQTGGALKALLPGEYQKQMIEPSEHSSQLPGQPTYRVCQVTDAAGSPIDVEVKTKGGFSFDTPPDYGKGLYFGNFLQAIFTPGQKAQPDEILMPAVKKSEEERNRPLSSCVGKQGQSKQGIEDPRAAEKETVVIPASGNVIDFFGSLIKKLGCIGNLLCKPVYIKLEATNFLAGAGAYHQEFTDQTSGFVNTQLPIKPHQDDSLVAQKIEAGQLVDRSLPESGLGQEQNVQGVDISLKEIGIPWGASVRDGFDSLLCSFLPGEFCSGNHPNPGVFDRIETPEDTASPPTQPITGVEAPASLTAIFAEAANWQAVPEGVIAGIARIEGSHLWGYSDEEIANYSKPDGKDPYPDFVRGADPVGIGCRVNDCAAAGPMQFLIGPDYLGNLDNCPTAKKWQEEDKLDQWPNVWAGYRDEVSSFVRYQAEVCNIRDSILGAAVKMATDGKRCGGGEWDRNLVSCVAQKYFGQCTKAFAHLGNRTYCQFVWDFYQGYKK